MFVFVILFVGYVGGYLLVAISGKFWEVHFGFSFVSLYKQKKLSRTSQNLPEIVANSPGFSQGRVRSSDVSLSPRVKAFFFKERPPLGRLRSEITRAYRALPARRTLPMIAASFFTPVRFSGRFIWCSLTSCLHLFHALKKDRFFTAT